MNAVMARVISCAFPITCIACGADLPFDDRFRICNDCSRKIKYITGLYCRTCGVPLSDGGGHCYACRHNGRRNYALIRSAAVYDGVIRDILHKFKYMNRDYLDRLLGALLEDAIMLSPYIADTDLVAAVPMHWAKKISRGYNQAELLAEKVAAYLHKPLLRGGLVRARFTGAQYRLSRAERQENMRNCFAARKRLDKKRILLIDDICTTGATIDACAAVLRKAGAKSVSALTVARDG